MCEVCVQEAGRLQTCKQAVINLSEDCLWNLLSSCSNVGETSEDQHLGCHRCHSCVQV